MIRLHCCWLAADGPMAHEQKPTTPANAANTAKDALASRQKRRVFGGVTHDEHGYATAQWVEVPDDRFKLFERVPLSIQSESIVKSKRTPADLRKLDQIIKARKLASERLASAQDDKD